jgi:hypothetical protein
MRKLRRMRYADHLARARGKSNMYTFYVKETPGKRRMRRCDDNIKIGLDEAGWEVVLWFNLGTVNTVVKFWVT